MEDLNNSYLLLNYNFKCIIKSTAEANVVGVFWVVFFFLGSTQVFFSQITNMYKVHLFVKLYPRPRKVFMNKRTNS